MYNFASVYIVLIVKKIMKTLVIIPSRLSAERLPGKPLMKIKGLSIISHVFKKAEEADLRIVIIEPKNVEFFGFLNDLFDKSSILLIFL